MWWRGAQEVMDLEAVVASGEEAKVVAEAMEGVRGAMVETVVGPGAWEGAGAAGRTRKVATQLYYATHSAKVQVSSEVWACSNTCHNNEHESL